MYELSTACSYKQINDLCLTEPLISTTVNHISKLDIFYYINTR